MKFGISCEIDSKIFIHGGGLEVSDGFKTFIFYVDEEHRLNKIRVIIKAQNPEKYFYKRQQNLTSLQFGVDFSYEPDVANDLIHELQLIESTLGIGGNLKSVKWQKHRFEYYPETTEEVQRIEITPAWFFLHDYAPDDSDEFTHEKLTLMVTERNKFQNAIVPMAFFREGKNDYRTGRYINAFQNFFYIIEGLFGNGKYKSEALITELKNSVVFNKFVQELIDHANNIPSKAEGLPREQLEEILRKYKQDYSVEGVIRYLVNERGRLHHFYLGSSIQQGNPFNHFDFKVSSVIAMGIAGESLIFFLDQETQKIRD